MKFRMEISRPSIRWEGYKPPWYMGFKSIKCGPSCAYDIGIYYLRPFNIIIRWCDNIYGAYILLRSRLLRPFVLYLIPAGVLFEGGRLDKSVIHHLRTAGKSEIEQYDFEKTNPFKGLFDGIF